MIKITDIIVLLAAIVTIIVGIISISQFFGCVIPNGDESDKVPTESILYDNEKKDETLQVHDNVVEIESGDKDAWCKKGDAFIEQSKYIEALQAYNNALKLNPSYLPALYGKALASKKLGHISDANAALKKANELIIVTHPALMSE
jgi:tetratricopeptide (TPR) repeat protein